MEIELLLRYKVTKKEQSFYANGVNSVSVFLDGRFRYSSVHSLPLDHRYFKENSAETTMFTADCSNF